MCNCERLAILYAEGLAWLLSLLYSTRSVNGRCMRVTPMSYSIEKVFTDGQLQDVSPVQSSPVQSSPVQSSPVQSLVTPIFFGVDLTWNDLKGN